MYVSNIKISNLRSLEKVSLDFVYPGREQDKPFGAFDHWPPRLDNVNLLIGVNGAGKSTILNGIALAVLSPIITQAGYVPYSLVRRHGEKVAQEASIEAGLVLHPQDLKPKSSASKCTVKTQVQRRGTTEVLRGTDEANPVWDGMFDDRSPAFLIVGYGATRRVGAVSASDPSHQKRRLPRYERVASLFEDQYALVPLATWLPEMRSTNKGRHNQVLGLINQLLPAGTRMTGDLEGGEYLFEHRRTKVPFGALSDGYRAYIGWIADLLHHVCMGCPSGKKLVDNKGIVLVDEIDLHIHPSWQRIMIPRLARRLPNLQFIFTSHSPLVVGGLERSNIYQLNWKGQRPVITRPDEEVYGLSADQILRSDVFGLESTRDPEFRDELASLARKATLGKKGAATQFMHQIAHGAGALDPEELSDPPEWLTAFAKKHRA